MKKIPRAPKRWKPDKRYKTGRKLTKEWEKWYFKYKYNDDITRACKKGAKLIEKNIFDNNGLLHRLKRKHENNP